MSKLQDYCRSILNGYRRVGWRIEAEAIHEWAIPKGLTMLQGAEIALWWRLLKWGWPWRAGITQEVQLQAMIDCVRRGEQASCYGWERLIDDRFGPAGTGRGEKKP